MDLQQHPVWPKQQMQSRAALWHTVMFQWFTSQYMESNSKLAKRHLRSKTILKSLERAPMYKQQYRVLSEKSEYYANLRKKNTDLLFFCAVANLSYIFVRFLKHFLMKNWVVNFFEKRRLLADKKTQFCLAFE